MTDQYYIDELAEGDDMEGFYLLKSLDQRTDRNGAPYYAGVICDVTGSLPIKAFNTDTVKMPDSLEEGSIVFCSYHVDYFQDSLYGNVFQLRPLQPQDRYNIEEIIPVAPEKSEKMFQELVDMAEAMEHPQIKAVTRELLLRHKAALLTIPGGKSMHHNVLGGLLYHMVRMARSGAALADIYPEVNKDLIVAGAIVHDIGKLKEYDTNAAGLIRDYTAAGDLLSHNILGILMLKDVCSKVNASETVFLPLAHMIESHHGLPERGSAIKPMFLEADLLHNLDMIDSRIWIFDRQQAALAPGEVSKPVKALSNPVYRPF